jgi:hypothetical protein
LESLAKFNQLIRMEEELGRMLCMRAAASGPPSACNCPPTFAGTTFVMVYHSSRLEKINTIDVFSISRVRVWNVS